LFCGDFQQSVHHLFARHHMLRDNIKMKKILFICSKNQWRSPTAEHVFTNYPDVDTDSAGTNSDAEVRVSTEQILWADIIFVMERTHLKKLNTKFQTALKNRKVICLGIPDHYQYMQQELVDILQKKMLPYLS
jgi:predicted protein tyrosine phosphatase